MEEFTRYDWLFIVSLSATWLILLYHVVLTYSAYRYYEKTIDHRNEKDHSRESYPMVSILIPAHNEEDVIENTVESLVRQEYPKDRYEIIVINDNSADATGEILARLQIKYPYLQVLTTVPPNGGKGKSNALNQALPMAKGEYIVVYDADNTPEKNAVLRLVNKIDSDNQLGAVVGKIRTRNRKTNLLTRFINIETLSFQWLVQAGRFNLLRLATIPGTNFIIRKSILERIGGWNLKALTEDTELTMRIYQLGYLIAWIPYAVTWEQEPETLRVWVKQRTRWARGNMWVIFHYIKNIKIMTNWRIATDIGYFFFTYTVFFLSVIISDIIFILGILGKLELTLGGPLFAIWILAYAVFVLQTFISLSFERDEATVVNFFIVVLMYFTYCQLWIFLMIRSVFGMIKDAILRREFKWYKTERTKG